jgi:hypothetical protein
MSKETYLFRGKRNIFTTYNVSEKRPTSVKRDLQMSKEAYLLLGKRNVVRQRIHEVAAQKLPTSAIVIRHCSFRGKLTFENLLLEHVVLHKHWQAQ